MSDDDKIKNRLKGEAIFPGMVNPPVSAVERFKERLRQKVEARIASIPEPIDSVLKFELEQVLQLIKETH